MSSVFDPQKVLPHLPMSAGVYLMYNHQNEIIYVGKAICLRKRVRQYFAKTPDPRPFVSTLPYTLHRIETISTLNEKEALLLERTLILKHQPRHNVALKFNAGQLYLKIDLHETWPRFRVVRQKKKDRGRYFGPYLSGKDLRSLTLLIERTFQIRSCDDRDFKNRTRPCLQYQIKRCSGPCVLPVSAQSYRAEIEEAILFLQGRHPLLLKKLNDKMMHASQNLEFEKAARYRDQIQAIERSLIPQEVVGSGGDQDVIGLYRQGDLIQVAIVEIRHGHVLKVHPFSFEDQGAESPEFLSTFLHLYYEQRRQIPPEILLPLLLEDQESLQGYLQELRDASVRLHTPQRGRLKRVLALAQHNAEHAFFQAQNALQARQKTLIETKKHLGLSSLPLRIEGYDVSLFHGEAPYVSQVVFEQGLPRKSEYRVRRIRDVEGTDDFAMMREALIRRFSPYAPQSLPSSTSQPSTPPPRQNLEEISSGTHQELPNLILIDGGKGQLAVAVSVLKDLGLDQIDVVALAKSRVKGTDDEKGVRRSAERIFLPSIKNPIVLRPGSAPFSLLTQVRDEAHKTALKAHRKKRSSTRLTSPLDTIKGVGPVRRKNLLKTLGSIQGVADASLETLYTVPSIPPDLAQRIYHAFRRSVDSDSNEEIASGED